MNEAPDLDLQMRLQAWLSPAFPIGAFAYSAGLETAAADGEATDAATLERWLICYLQDGPGRSDAIFLARAAESAAARNWPALAEISALAAAFAPSAERRLEARAQGGAFLKAARAAHPWPHGAAQRAAEQALGQTPVYAVALGAWAGAWTTGFAARGAWASALFLHATASNLISAGQRLGLLGQTEGQALLTRLGPELKRIGQAAADAPLDDIGGCMIRGDLAGMRHETQNVRLFRS